MHVRNFRAGSGFFRMISSGQQKPAKICSSLWSNHDTSIGSINIYSYLSPKVLCGSTAFCTLLPRTAATRNCRCPTGRASSVLRGYNHRWPMNALYVRARILSNPKQAQKQSGVSKTEHMALFYTLCFASQASGKPRKAHCTLRRWIHCPSYPVLEMCQSGC